MKKYLAILFCAIIGMASIGWAGPQVSGSGGEWGDVPTAGGGCRLHDCPDLRRPGAGRVESTVTVT